MSWKGPTALLVAWVIHDLEEARAFPASCDRLVHRTGLERLKMTPRQSWTAVGLMGILVTSACVSGMRSGGASPTYRAVAAGLEAHVATHLGASVAVRGYAAGAATALPIMLPGAFMARRELDLDGHPLTFRDTVNGVALLIPAALVCQVTARLIPATADESTIIAHDWPRSAAAFGGTADGGPPPREAVEWGPAQLHSAGVAPTERPPQAIRTLRK